jgi:hypothetical protein
MLSLSLQLPAIMEDRAIGFYAPCQNASVDVRSFIYAMREYLSVEHVLILLTQLKTAANWIAS